MKPLISLVSGTFNRIKLLRPMIESFRSNLPPAFPYEIVLIDGGSTDGTIAWCKAQPDIRLIEQGELRGAIRAFTDGANAARGQFVLLGNDDIIFASDSVMKAFVHLDEHSRCGAVAFQDDRPVPGTERHKFKTLTMPGQVNGRQMMVRYAQVGLFRAWLGNHPSIGWWGADTGMKEAALQKGIYAGDNWLSAKILENGYRVDEVPGCYIIDHVIEDELREINRTRGIEAKTKDSDIYYRNWHKNIGGPIVASEPILPQQDAGTVRVLYLPIYEPGWPVQKEQKRGLRDAFNRAKTPNGYHITVYELDYLGVPSSKLEDMLLNAADVFKPHLIFTQIQATQPLNRDMLAKLRALHPHATLVNWNGDESQGGLVSQAMLELLRHVDLQLTVNASTLDVYRSHGIKADYWQIGFEEPNEPLPDMPAHDVVFLGSFSNPARLPLLESLKALTDEGYNVGVYTPGDASATLYDFAKGKNLYRNSRLAVGSNEYQGSYGFFSNRVIQAMAAGNTLLLQQTIPGIAELTGITPGVHFVDWTTPADFISKIHYYLDPENEGKRRKIADAGTKFIREFHSFDYRVIELFALMKKHLGKAETPDGDAIYLRYIGRADYEFGIQSREHENIKYLYKPGQPLLVSRYDAPHILASGDWMILE